MTSIKCIDMLNKTWDKMYKVIKQDNDTIMTCMDI